MQLFICFLKARKCFIHLEQTCVGTAHVVVNTSGELASHVGFVFLGIFQRFLVNLDRIDIFFVVDKVISLDFFPHNLRLLLEPFQALIHLTELIVGKIIDLLEDRQDKLTDVLFLLQKDVETLVQSS